jgi:hypothetical protein
MYTVLVETIPQNALYLTGYTVQFCNPEYFHFLPLTRHWKPPLAKATEAK